MRRGSRFTLKAILGCTAAVCIPLALIAAGFHLAGVVVLNVVAVGCIVYLMDGLGGLGNVAKTVGVVLLPIAGFAVLTCLFYMLSWYSRA